MRFRTENEFTHFKFSDVHVSDIMMSFGTFVKYYIKCIKS